MTRNTGKKNTEVRTFYARFTARRSRERLGHTAHMDGVLFCRSAEKDRDTKTERSAAAMRTYSLLTLSNRKRRWTREIISASLLRRSTQLAAATQKCRRRWSGVRGVTVPAPTQRTNVRTNERRAYGLRSRGTRGGKSRERE